MAIVYTPVDQQLRESVKMVILDKPAFAGGLGDLGNVIGKNFPFQFPPRVKGDNKSAEWEEKKRVSYEPVAYYMGAEARRLQIEAMYFVTGEKKWSGSEIAKLAQSAKAYFYRTIESVYSNKGFGPVVEITSLYGAVQEKSTWRMTSVEAEYAETFVRDDTPPTPGPKTNTKINLGFRSFSLPNPFPPPNREVPKTPLWPLWTKIIFELKSWTRNAGINGDGEKLANEALEPHPTPKWY